VGIAGGHPIPVNESMTLLGHAVQLQWRLHDRIARKSPKMGEIVAFRNVIPSIPFDTAVDELSIQAIITQLGYRLVYEPEAVVYNRGPATVQDFLHQRHRIYAGHLRIREQQAYSASTMSARRDGRAPLGSESFTTPKAILWSIGTIGLAAEPTVERRPSPVSDPQRDSCRASSLTRADTGLADIAKCAQIPPQCYLHKRQSWPEVFRTDLTGRAKSHRGGCDVQ